MPKMRVIKPLVFTTLSLFAFAANSILCRLALGEKVIDATGFTSVRLLSGAFVLLCILKFSGKKNGSSTKGSGSAAFMLFLYAVTFSFAYLTLNTGTGALILFGSVQISLRLALSALLTLGGILMVILGRNAKNSKNASK